MDEYDKNIYGKHWKKNWHDIIISIIRFECFKYEKIDSSKKKYQSSDLKLPV